MMMEDTGQERHVSGRVDIEKTWFGLSRSDKTREYPLGYRCTNRSSSDVTAPVYGMVIVAFSAGSSARPALRRPVWLSLLS